MTRRKVRLAYITNEAERKASFKKRKKGLLKKVEELTTLCDVEACAIIYSQYETEPAVWPSREGAEAVLARFRSLSVIDQTRKMMNQETFTRQRIRKAEEQLRRARRENKHRELENFMYSCLAGDVDFQDFNVQDGAEMGWVVNQALREISEKLESFNVNGAGPSSAAGGGSSSNSPLESDFNPNLPALPPPPPPEPDLTTNLLALPPPPPRENVRRSVMPPEKIYKPVMPPENVYKSVMPPENVYRPIMPPENVYRPIMPPEIVYRPVMPSENVYRPIMPALSLPQENVWTPVIPSENVYRTTMPALPPPPENVYIPVMPTLPQSLESVYMPALVSQPPPPAPVHTPLPELPPLTPLPPPGYEMTEGFPWIGPEGTGPGWDDDMDLRYPYLFDHGNNDDGTGNGVPFGPN